MVDHLAAFVNTLLANYVESLNLGLKPSDYAWLEKNIVSQLELSAHNMVREAITDLSQKKCEQPAEAEDQLALRREGKR